MQLGASVVAMISATLLVGGKLLLVWALMQPMCSVRTRFFVVVWL